MPLYGASLWDSFTTRRFKMPFKTLDRDWWNCAGLNRTFDARTLWCSISCIPTFYLNKKVDASASILMQRAVLRLTTTSKGAIFHLNETFDPLRARFSPNPARYSGDEIRSIVAILKFFFFIFGKSFKFLFRLDKREEKSIYDWI